MLTGISNKLIKHCGNGSKKTDHQTENRTNTWRKRINQNRKPFDKLRIYSFFFTDQKYAETDRKKETYQQTMKFFKLLLKTINGANICGNGPKKEEIDVQT